METAFEYIKDNIEWIFSGIGVLVLSIIFGIFKKRKHPQYIINNNINLDNFASNNLKSPPDLKPLEKDGDILVRKSFTTTDVTEFFDILGFETIIRQLDKSVSSKLFVQELCSYSELNSPILIVFEVPDEKETKTGIARIKSVNFNEYKRNTEKLQFGNLIWDSIININLVHNKIDYTIDISKKNDFTLNSQKQGVLTGKTIKPVFLLLTAPENTFIQSLDILVELYAIDLLFFLMLDKQIKESKEFTWEIKLIKTDKISKKVLNKIGAFLSSEFCWQLSCKVNSEPFVDMYFYNEVNKKLKVLPIFKDKYFEKAFREFMKINLEGLKKHDLRTVLLDNY